MTIQDLSSEMEFKNYCKDFLANSLEVLANVADKDSVSQYTHVTVKLVHGKYDRVTYEQRKNYNDFLIKYEDKITANDSFHLANLIVSEKPTVKLFFKGKIYDEKGAPVVADLSPYTSSLLLDLILNYLDESQTFDYKPQTFKKIFREFIRYIEEDINTIYYFSPLYNFSTKIDNVKLQDELQIKRISEVEFKEVANLGMIPGKQPRPEPDFWQLTHVICTTLHKPDNFYADNQMVLSKFNSMLTTLRMFKSGDVDTGALYRKYSPTWNTIWNTRGIHVIGNERKSRGNRVLSLLDEESTSFKTHFMNFYFLKFDSNNRFLEMAMRRFTSALSKVDVADKIVDYVISLESLLLSGAGETALRFSYRGAILLGTDDNNREFLWKFLRESYNLRSGIVHGEGIRKFSIDTKPLSRDQICTQLESISRTSIAKMLLLQKRYKAHAKILDELDLCILNLSRLQELRKTLD